ncbi:transposable element Tc1 transposase [Trichonephila clavipes]|nr:transposable element Tc1 transposase [Trichonephila clavipes]
MAVFVLDALPVNAVLQSAFSNVIVTEHPELCARARSRSHSLRHPWSLQQNNALPHVARYVRDFFSAQHMTLLPWPAYSPGMSPIQHVWDLVCRRLARDLRSTASKDELWGRFQTISNSLPQDIQHLFESMLRRTAASLIVAPGGYTK